MTKTTVTHEGQCHSFTCALTTWKLREDLIRAICAGKPVQIKSGDQWEEIDFCDITEDNLYLCRLSK